MKKLDKLILKSFIGPLILTFCVSVFILLIQYMLKYFDDLVGKDLGYSVFAELIIYFSINMTPIALPLAILIASIMTYGNLGEHFELTAIKGSGISLTRTLLPTGMLVAIISIAAYFSNNFVVPNANLRAYSLLYDIKHKKPSLDLKEGQFYEGIPNYSIKIREKHKNGIAMSDIIIYDHKGGAQGNKKVIIADSCRMYTIINDRYLMMELFNGNHYIEGENKKRSDKNKIETFTRTKFSNMKMVFSLASFDLDRTDIDLFAGNRLMKNTAQLTEAIDSMTNSMLTTKFQAFRAMSSSYRYHFQDDIPVPEQIQLAQDEFLRKQSIRDSLKNLEEMEIALEEEIIEELSEEEKEFANATIKDEQNTDKTKTKQQAPKTLKPQATPGDEKKVTDEKVTPAEKVKTTKLNKSNTAERLKKFKDTNQAAKLLSKNSLGKTKAGEVNKEEPRKKDPKKAKSIVKSPNQQKKRTGKTSIAKTPKKYNGKEIDSTYIENDSILLAVKDKIDEFYSKADKKKNMYTRAAGAARSIKTNLSSKIIRVGDYERHTNQHKLEKSKKLSQAIACFIMFLIGAPLGAIIKKGGLGMPVVVSIFFFIIFYVMTVIADKWAKVNVVDGFYAAWIADLALLPFGILFMYQARKDAKLFDADFYTVWWQNMETWWKKRQKRRLQPANN
ncbi:MAG: LptF/LptG family permease [Cyclobacteriaceae bacterium]